MNVPWWQSTPTSEQKSVKSCSKNSVVTHPMPPSQRRKSSTHLLAFSSTSLPLLNNLLVSSLFISTSPGKSPLQSSLPPKCL